VGPSNESIEIREFRADGVYSGFEMAQENDVAVHTIRKESLKAFSI
jgi:hypothetical protein